MEFQQIFLMPKQIMKIDFMNFIKEIFFQNEATLLLRISISAYNALQLYEILMNTHARAQYVNNN